MAVERPKQILVVEDAKGIARGYATILEDAGYEVTLCFTGEQAKQLITQKRVFDLAIMDIVLPAEDQEKHSLKESHDTGLRLIRRMVDECLCDRFYVITVRDDLEEKLRIICKAPAKYLYETKLAYEPENLVENVEGLIGPPRNPHNQVVLTEFHEHIETLEAYSTMLGGLDKADESQLAASIRWIRHALSEPSDPRLMESATRTKRLLETQYRGKTSREQLNQEVQNTLAVIETWLKKHA